MLMMIKIVAIVIELFLFVHHNFFITSQFIKFKLNSYET